MSGARRSVVGALAAVCLLPAVARADRHHRDPRRVFVCLFPSNAPDPIGPTRRWYAGEFAKHGLSDGRDIEITILRAPTQGIEELVGPVREAVSLRADVIIVHGGGKEAREHFLPVARHVPLVMFGPDDGTGDTIEALNREGRNITGVMYSYFELVVKRFELMKQLRPKARRAAIVDGQARSTELLERVKRLHVARLTTDIGRLGMEFVPIEVHPDSAADAIADALREARVDFAELLCCHSPALWGRLTGMGIATSVVGPVAVKEGALLGGWSVGYVASAVRLAARVLKGAKAKDIPVERPMEFGLAINLRTAKALGLEVPPSMVLRADQVFE